MALRRGFKSEANSYAREFREELKLSPRCPMSPWGLAEHLCIPVVPLSALRPCAPKAVDFLMGPGRNFFSAVAVGSGYKRAILHNDASAITRQASDLAHELAHAILGHPVVPAFDEHKKRSINREYEDEAAWLGPALLVSEEAALHVARSGEKLDEAARTYGVSAKLLRMRLNVTGALRRVAASR